MVQTLWQEGRASESDFAMPAATSGDAAGRRAEDASAAPGATRQKCLSIFAAVRGDAGDIENAPNDLTDSARVSDFDVIKHYASVLLTARAPLSGLLVFAARTALYVKGFGCRHDVIVGPVQRPASESLRRTNPREAASSFPSMGIFSDSDFGEA